MVLNTERCQRMYRASCLIEQNFALDARQFRKFEKFWGQDVSQRELHRRKNGNINVLAP